jgi:glycosyltransferase involved in cell wall biosynthesis
VIRSNHAEGFVVMFPPVPFEHSHILMQLLQRRRAIFVSCSKGESFGLSAAEAMTTGLPVILSDIPPHAALAGGSEGLLYPLADFASLTNRMAAAITNYEALSAKSLELARHFSEQAFLDDWRRVAATCPAGIV